jgi:hypothetical protein
MNMPRPVLYPSLLAAYSVLALAAANPAEIPGWWVLSRPLVISLLVSLCAWILLGAFSRDRDRRAFLTLVVVALFVWYENFVLGLGAIIPRTRVAHPLIPMGLIIAYLVALTYLVLRVVPSLRSFTRFMTIFTAILLVWAATDVLRHAMWWGELAPASNPSSLEHRSTTTGAKSGPDIYLIVLDKYTGSRSLKANFGFDNADFEMYLENRGFMLPRHAQSNYIYTALSLASLLNFRYLDDLPAERAALSRTKAYVNRLVENNAVSRFLQLRQYRFIFFPTEFSVTGRNRLADLQLPEPSKIRSEFEIVWRRGTLAEPMVGFMCQRIRCVGDGTLFSSEARLLEWKFDQLSRVPRWPRDGRPLFVFAHLPIPHEPYVFRSDCSVRPPFWPSFYVVQDETPEKEAYIAQIACLNRRLETIVQAILEDSPTPPVIILQSDHGHGRMPLEIPDLQAVTPDRVMERAEVFAAYYLPGASRDVIYDSITPVNVFRTLFRQYFQADLSPLPDKTYWSPGRALFRFTRVNRGPHSPQ